jgi:deazaflavin-dependent oxidoreductase (nitroreductase family)
MVSGMRVPATLAYGRLVQGLLRSIARLFGPISRPLAGRRWFRLWAIVHHRGRRSGRRYATPVAIRATAGGAVIPLPFGDRTQWHRNVLAAGGCVVRWGGEDVPMVDPEVVDRAAAEAAFNRLLRFLIRRAGIHAFLRLRRS